MRAADVDDDALPQRKKKLKEKCEAGIRKGLGVDEDAQVPHLKELKVVAVIDEAGSDSFYCNVDNLMELRHVICSAFPSNCCHPVVLGTGLDLLTNSVSGAGKGIAKVRLLPWQIEDFVLFAKNNSIAKLVKKHDVHSKLATTPRAAARLLECLLKTETWANEEEKCAACCAKCGLPTH